MGKEVLQWHPGFYAAIRAEFGEDCGRLVFERERNLTKKPLQIDLLVKKSEAGTPIKSFIGEIFSKYNIMEYKSPGDTLAIDDYYKVIAYACLLKAEGAPGIDSISTESITITFVCSRMPRKLVKHLQSVHQIRMVKRHKGIFDLKGAQPFRMQLIINDPEKGGPYPWLNALTDRLGENDREYVESLLNIYNQSFDEDKEAVLGLMLRANWKILNSWKEDENMSMLQEELRRLFAPELAEAVENGEKRGVEIGERRGDANRSKMVACNMYQRGFTAEEAAGLIGIKPEEVEAWYKEMKAGKGI